MSHCCKYNKINLTFIYYDNFKIKFLQENENLEINPHFNKNDDRYSLSRRIFSKFR